MNVTKEAIACCILLLSTAPFLAISSPGTGVATDPTEPHQNVGVAQDEGSYVEQAQRGSTSNEQPTTEQSVVQPAGEDTFEESQEQSAPAKVAVKKSGGKASARLATLPPDEVANEQGKVQTQSELGGQNATDEAYDVTGDPLSVDTASIPTNGAIYSIGQVTDSIATTIPESTTKFKRLLNVVQNSEVIATRNNEKNIFDDFKRCGAFVACRVKMVTILNLSVSMNSSNYHGYALNQINSLTKSMTEELHVICDLTSVNTVIAFAILLAIVIFMSNVIIIIVTLRTKKLRRPHGYFKISLAVADLMNGAFVLTNISSNMVRYIYYDGKLDSDQTSQLRKEEPNYAEAAFFGICAVLSHVVTVYSVFLLSVDSFLSIRWPVQYKIGELMTSKRAVILIAVVWIFAAAVSALPLLAYDYVRYSLSFSTFSFIPYLEPIDSSLSNEDAFLASYIHVILYAILVWGLPFFATWMLTLLTAYHSSVAFKSKRLTRNRAPGAQRSGIGRLEIDLLRTVTIVLVMLTLTVLPVFVCLIMMSATASDNVLCLEKKITDFMFASYYILVCGSFLNVIVYNACHIEFRRATVNFFRDIGNFFCAGSPGKFCELKSFRQLASLRTSWRRSGVQSRRTPDLPTVSKASFSDAKLKKQPGNVASLENIPLDECSP